MRLLIAGDTHGDLAWIRHLIQVAQNNKCERILQVGDFGFWPHYESGVQFLEKTSKWLTAAGIPLYWLDGNHENHDEIAALLAQHESNGFILHKPSLFYVPRGLVWEWAGVNFMALGGAYSIDATHRTPGMSWWAGETISDVDVQRAIDNAEGDTVDVFLSHDCPVGPTPWLPNSTEDRQKDRWPQSVANRKRLSQVVDAVRPKELFHGHYHLRYDDRIMVGSPAVQRPCFIHGLGRDGDAAGSTVVFDTDVFLGTRAD